MFEAFGRFLRDFIGRIQRPVESRLGIPSLLEAKGQDRKPSSDQDRSGLVAGQVVVDASATATSEGRHLGTGYLVVPGASKDHPTSDLPAGVGPATTPDERRLSKLVAPEALTRLSEGLKRVGPRAYPFRTLVIDRLTALPKVLEALSETTGSRDHDKAAILATAVVEGCLLLADDLVHQGAGLTKSASNLEKAVRDRDRRGTASHARALANHIERFESAVETKKQEAFQAGEKLARSAVGKQYSGVADNSLVLARDASLLAFLGSGIIPTMGEEIELKSSLMDRTLRLQQALIARNWVAASRLSRELYFQASIMADPTVKLAVSLIAKARNIREATRALSASDSKASKTLGELTAPLAHAVPMLVARLEDRLFEVDRQFKELQIAVANRDYPSAAGLGARLGLTVQVARHGIVVKATSLTTVTAAIVEAAAEGDANLIVTLLEGV